MNNIHKTKTTIALFVGVTALLLSATGAWATGAGITTNHFVNATDHTSPVTWLETFVTSYANNGTNDVCNVLLNGVTVKTFSRVHITVNNTGSLKNTAWPNGQPGQDGTTKRKWQYGPGDTATGITVHFVDTYTMKSTDLFLADPRFNGTMIYTLSSGAWHVDASVITPVSGAAPLPGTDAIADAWGWKPLWKQDGTQPTGDWQELDALILKGYTDGLNNEESARRDELMLKVYGVQK